MTTVKSAVVALTAVLCAVTMTASAEARGFGHFGGGHFGGGHFGGHYGHVGHIGNGGWGHGGHWGHGHWGHRGWGPGFGIYAPYYSSYYDDDDYGDCYRVYRYHAWRTVCD